MYKKKQLTEPQWRIPPGTRIINNVLFTLQTFGLAW